MPGIAVLASEGISLFHLSVPSLVFGRDRRDAGLPRHEVVVCAQQPGPVATADGLPVEVAHGLEALAELEDLLHVLAVVPLRGHA